MKIVEANGYLWAHIMALDTKQTLEQRRDERIQAQRNIERKELQERSTASQIYSSLGINIDTYA